ncbi:DUF6907 domain-containing protein [Streptomyces lavendulae]|uniref:DUF6907 domain-containing protein n=1 Tax=Streptomyces lavendulae TaxID=1914 RepID=UPI0024A593A1|nr:hypothetical protein Sros01_15060 [Streptomyces roseochromogenus]
MSIPVHSDLPGMFRPAPKLSAVPKQPTAKNRETFPIEVDAPRTEPRTGDLTVTYPLLGGGFLAAPCPSWCTTDHSDDAEHGINPGDLLHQGDELALPFTLADGSTISVLAVRIEQYPYAHDGDSDRVHAALVPSADDGESTGYLSAAELQAEISRVSGHLQALRHLAEELAEARVEEHTAYFTSLGETPEGRWGSLTRDDVATMPIWYLLKVFRATIEEVDSPDRTIVEHLLAHPDGTHTVKLDRRLTQIMREQSTRALLANRLQAARVQR